MDEFDRLYIIEMAYRTATLTSPSIDVMMILNRLPLDRIMELMLIMRQAGYVRSPKNFLQKAIRENWKPEGVPERFR